MFPCAQQHTEKHTKHTPLFQPQSVCLNTGTSTGHQRIHEFRSAAVTELISPVQSICVDSWLVHTEGGWWRRRCCYPTDHLPFLCVGGKAGTSRLALRGIAINTHHCTWIIVSNAEVKSFKRTSNALWKS